MVGRNTRTNLLHIAAQTVSFLFNLAMDKENQDAFTVLPHLGKPGGSEQAFFGVYDGHGRDGHQCARYVRDKVRFLFILYYALNCRNDRNSPFPFQLSNQILETLERTPNGSLTSADIKKALMDSHIRVNENGSVFSVSHMVYLSSMNRKMNLTSDYRNMFW